MRADGWRSARARASGHAPKAEKLVIPPPHLGYRAGKRFIDIQDDVTVEDIELAARENFRSVEHLKRYTTLGMGTDQGKTSNVNGLTIMGALRSESPGAVGTTTFRPPLHSDPVGAAVRQAYRQAFQCGSRKPDA